MIPKKQKQKTKTTKHIWGSLYKFPDFFRMGTFIEVSWCPSCLNSLWQGWSCGHCPAGNATDPIWRVLASSDGISSWTPLKPQHSYPNPNHLANQLWCIDFLTPSTPLIIPHRLHALLEFLMPLKNWCSIHVRWSKSSLRHSIRFFGIIFKFKTQFYCISFF